MASSALCCFVGVNSLSEGLGLLHAEMLKMNRIQRIIADAFFVIIIVEYLASKLGKPYQIYVGNRKK
jgi:hypothetical protein